MIVAMSRVLSLSHDHITPDPNPAPGAPRPYDARMDSSRLEALGISHHTAFDVGIKECLSPWLVQGNGQRKGRQGWVWGVKHCCYCCSQGYYIVKICKERETFRDTLVKFKLFCYDEGPVYTFLILTVLFFSRKLKKMAYEKGIFSFKRKNYIYIYDKYDIYVASYIVACLLYFR